MRKKCFVFATLSAEFVPPMKTTPCQILLPFPQINFNRKIYKAAPRRLSPHIHTCEPIRRTITAYTSAERARGAEKRLARPERSARQPNHCLSLAESVTQRRERNRERVRKRERGRERKRREGERGRGPGSNRHIGLRREKKKTKKKKKEEEEREEEEESTRPRARVRESVRERERVEDWETDGRYRN